MLTFLEPFIVTVRGHADYLPNPRKGHMSLRHFQALLLVFWVFGYLPPIQVSVIDIPELCLMQSTVPKFSNHPLASVSDV